jgi:drug/metabolite transporter (DMT)-like permease
MIDLIWALIIWLIVVIIIYFIAKKNRVRTWSALILSLLVGGIVLALLRPPNSNMRIDSDNITSTLYALIMFLTPLLIIIYAVTMAVRDIAPQVEVTANSRKLFS